MIEANTSLLDAALAYAKLGFAVFPVHNKRADGSCSCNNTECKSIGKHPRTANGLKDATKDPALIRFWWSNAFQGCNLAIATGAISGFFVVDVDVKHDGLKAWANFKDDNGLDDYETPVQETPSGGYHVFYNMPIEGKVLTKTNVLGMGIDIRGDGGYIVAAPSDGYYYLAEQNIIDTTIEQAHQAILDKVVKIITVDNNTPSMPVKSGLYEIYKDERNKIIDALQHVDPDDYSTWWNIGAALHSTNGTEAFEWWCEWAKESSKYVHAEQIKKWNEFDARRGTTETAIQIEYLYKEAEAKGWVEVFDHSDCFFDPNITNEEFQMMIAKSKKQNQPTVPDAILETESIVVHNYHTLKEYNNKWPVDRFWDDGALFQGATMMISGEPKIGKSMSVLEMCAQAAIGGEFLGKGFSRPLKTLWLQAEITEAFLPERMKIRDFLTDEQKELFDKNFLFSGKFTIDVLTDAGIGQLIRLVYQLEIDLIAIDPVINISTANENDNREVVHMLKRLDLLKVSRCPNGRRPLTAVLIAHHMKKGSDPEQPFDGIRGASAFRGYFDSGLALINNPDCSEAIDIYFEYRNQKSPDMSSFKFDENHQIKPCTVIPFDDGSASALPEEKVIADKLHLLPPNEPAFYLFVRDYLKENGKTIKEDLVFLMAKNRVQGVTFRKTISKTLTTVCKQSLDYGGEIHEVNHLGMVWLELLGAVDES